MRFLTVALVAAFFVSPVQAQEAGVGQVEVACGPYTHAVRVLTERYKERPVSRGLSDRGLMIEVWVSPQGTFTVVMVNPQGGACFLASGEGWEAVEAPKESSF